MLKRLGDAVEAEDVTQEVFLQTYRSLGSYQGRSTLLTWMFGIAHNQVRRRFRRKAPSLVRLDDVDTLELVSLAPLRTVRWTPPASCGDASMSRNAS